MTHFIAAKERLRLQEVVERYTAQTVRRGKALCPFHNDNTPSMSVKNERFRCFVCEAHGDAIGFVAQLFNETQGAALARLNGDFALNLPLNTAQPKEERIAQAKQWQYEKAVKEAFARWEDDTHSTLAVIHRNARWWRHEHAPSDPEDPLHPRYLFAIREIDWLRHVLDVFIFEEQDARIALYKNKKMMEEINAIEQQFSELAYGGGARCADSA